MTSFHGGTRVSKMSQGTLINYLPIRPAPINPFYPGLQLEFEDNSPIQGSWVNIGEAHWVPWSMITLFKEDDPIIDYYRFCEVSTDLVQRLSKPALSQSSPSLLAEEGFSQLLDLPITPMYGSPMTVEQHKRARRERLRAKSQNPRLLKTMAQRVRASVRDTSPYTELQQPLRISRQPRPLHRSLTKRLNRLELLSTVLLFVVGVLLVTIFTRVKSS